MNSETITAEAVSQTLEACFPIEREVELATFTDTATGRTKTLEATICGYWDGESYQFDGIDYSLLVTCDESPMTMLTPFGNSGEAIAAYNALDLAELKPEEWPNPANLPQLPDEYPTMTSPLPGGIPGRMEHYAPIQVRVTGASGSSVLGEEE